MPDGTADSPGTAAPDAGDGVSAQPGGEPPAGEPPAGLPAIEDAGGPARASEAFGALGNEARTAVLAALAGADGPVSFSGLFEAAPVDTTAGFAYHLRQLDGRFVRGTDDGYVLTAAGRRVARGMAARAYAGGTGFGPVAVGDPCPHCGEEALVARAEDGYATVACGACERPVLSLPVPPGADGAGSAEEVLDVLDRHNRRRLSAMADGVCPDCGARVEGSVRRPPDRVLDDGTGPDGAAAAGDVAAGDVAAGDAAAGGDPPTRAWVSLDCSVCGYGAAVPPTLSVLDHPAVVSFYHEHGRDAREPPLWNVGAEWREAVVSEDPWCVRVATALDGDELALYLDGDGGVVGTDRRPAS